MALGGGGGSGGKPGVVAGLCCRTDVGDEEGQEWRPLKTGGATAQMPLSRADKEGAGGRGGSSQKSHFGFVRLRMLVK